MQEHCHIPFIRIPVVFKLCVQYVLQLMYTIEHCELNQRHYILTGNQQYLLQLMHTSVSSLVGEVKSVILWTRNTRPLLLIHA